jgi:hypothetical protein
MASTAPKLMYSFLAIVMLLSAIASRPKGPKP